MVAFVFSCCGCEVMCSMNTSIETSMNIPSGTKPGNAWPVLQCSEVNLWHLWHRTSISVNCLQYVQCWDLHVHDEPCTMVYCVQWHDGNCYVFVDEGDLEFRCRSVCGLLHRCRLVILLLCHRCHSATITTSSDSVLSSAFWNQLKVRLGPSKVSQWRTAEHYWS